MIEYVLTMIVVLGVLVFVHELGHFVAAKLFGVRVERFSIGFPPRLFGVKVGETDYCISIVPLGGYVKLSGMIDESMDATQMDKEPEPYEFRAKPTYQKVIIITAGVVMNFLFAIGVLGMMLWFQGEPIDPTTRIGYVEAGGLADSIGVQVDDEILEINGQEVSVWQDVNEAFINNLGSTIIFQLKREDQFLTKELSWDNLKLKDMERLRIYPWRPAAVGEVVPNYPAIEAGLQSNDRIVAINDTTINSWFDMTKIVSASAEKPLDFKVLRGTDTLALAITPTVLVQTDADGNETKLGRIGISYVQDYRDIDFLSSIVKGYDRAILLGKLNILGFSRLLSGKEDARESLAGPIAIAQAATQIAQRSLVQFIEFIALLSIVLAIVNILPIPALDGGHLVIILIEGIMKRPLALKTKMMVQQVGMALLLVLMVFVFYNDIMRLLTTP